MYSAYLRETCNSRRMHYASFEQIKLELYHTTFFAKYPFKKFILFTTIHTGSCRNTFPQSWANRPRKTDLESRHFLISKQTTPLFGAGNVFERTSESSEMSVVK